MKNLWLLLFLGIFSFTSCSKKKEVDELSYIVLSAAMTKNKKIELQRTQIIAVKNQKNLSSVILAFAKDKNVPSQASKLAKNAYALRFTLHDSFTRSKTFGGGTFVLKFENLGAGKMRVRNFKKSLRDGIVRFPQFSIDTMDTILNPEIVSINNANHECIVNGCKGILSASSLNPDIYIIEVVFQDAAGEIWGVDHGYINDAGVNKEPTKIINPTNLGIEVAFAGHGRIPSTPTYNPKTLGHFKVKTDK
jgi:hypothetical protein